MIYLLWVATGYLLVTSLILLRNRVNFTPLHTIEGAILPDNSPKVSICMPARNEENSIRKCVVSALDQDYPNMEVLVLDDRSEDSTRSVLTAIDHPRKRDLRILDGREKPGDWLGKPWACHQLGKAASGDILIFMDADVWLTKKTVARVVRSMGRDIVDFITVWPRQVLGSFPEQLVIPLIYHALLSVLPSNYIYRSPRWMPGILKRRFAPLFAAACGQFMAFKKTTYEGVGGHEAVQGAVVEDVALARLVRKKGYRMKMYHGGDTDACRMYRSGGEIRQGLRKNFLAGFGYRVPLFLAAGFLQLLVFLLPPLTLLSGILTSNPSLMLWSAFPLSLMLVQRVILSSWFEWNPVYAFLHPLGVLWFQWLGWTVLRDYYQGQKAEWKGRSV